MHLRLCFGIMLGGLFRGVRGLLWRRIILEARVVNVSTGSSLDPVTASSLPDGNHTGQNVTASSPCFGTPIWPCTPAVNSASTCTPFSPFFFSSPAPRCGRGGRLPLITWNGTRRHHLNIWLFSGRSSKKLEPRKQIAPGSLILWSLEGLNWIMDSHLSMCNTFVHVTLMRLGGPCCVNVLCGPLTLVHQFQSGSTTPPPHLHDPSPLGCQHPHVYSIIAHYLISARRRRPSTRRDETGSDFTKRKKQNEGPFFQDSSIRVFSGGNHWTAKA